MVDNFGYSATKIFVTAFLDDLAAEIGETCQVVGNLIGNHLTKGRVPKIKNVFVMVFYHTGGGGVSEGSEKTILLF